MQQIALQKNVSQDIRNYLKVDEGINLMIFGESFKVKGVAQNKSLFYAYEKTQKSTKTEDTLPLGSIGASSAED
jgi:hypothetical protein